MLAHLSLDLLKWIGVLTFVTGLAGAFLLSDHEQRRRSAQWVATPGLVLTWLGGYGLLTWSGISLASTWVSGALLITITLLALALTAVRHPSMRLGYGAFAALLLLGNLLLMIEKPGTEFELERHSSGGEVDHEP